MNVIKRLPAKIRRIVFAPIATLIALSIIILNFMVGVVKAAQTGIICDPVHEPINNTTTSTTTITEPIICDPVHEPSFTELLACPIQNSILFTLLTLVAYPLYLTKWLISCLRIDITTNQLIYKLTIRGLITTILVSTLFTIFNVLVSIFSPCYYGSPTFLEILPAFFIMVFIMVNLLSGILLLLFSIKDKKFLTAGVYFITLLPGVILGLFFLTLKLFSPKSSYLPKELRRN